MAPTQNFEIFMKLADFYETIRKFLRLPNTDFIPQCQFTRLFNFCSPYCIYHFDLCYFDHKFVSSHPINSLVLTYIEIRQFIKIFGILSLTVRSAILNFIISASNSKSSSECWIYMNLDIIEFNVLLNSNLGSKFFNLK